MTISTKRQSKHDIINTNSSKKETDIMPMPKKDKTGLINTTIRNVDKDIWKKFQALCTLEESDASRKLRLYMKRCVNDGRII